MKKLSGIILRESMGDRAVADFSEKPGQSYDVESSFFAYMRKDIIGIPADIDPLDIAEDAEISPNFPVVGHIHGTLILCREMVDSGYNVYQLCDDMSADLEFVMSALMEDEDIALEMGCGLDVFDIDEIFIKDECRGQNLHEQVITWLPWLIFKLTNVYPNLLTYYPQPISDNWESVTERDQAVVNQIFAQTYDTPSVSREGNIVKLPTRYMPSEDDINRALGRRHSGSSYPAHLKDAKKIAWLENLGFWEINETRMFVKNIDLDR